MLMPELLCADEMHTLHLGVFQDFCLAVLWQILENGGVNIRGDMAEGDYRPLAFSRLRGELISCVTGE